MVRSDYSYYWWSLKNWVQKAILRWNNGNLRNHPPHWSRIIERATQAASAPSLPHEVSGEQSSKLYTKPASRSGTKGNLIIVTDSVVFCRRLRWDTYCRNDPNEYGLNFSDKNWGYIKWLKYFLVFDIDNHFHTGSSLIFVHLTGIAEITGQNKHINR